MDGVKGRFVALFLGPKMGHQGKPEWQEDSLNEQQAWVDEVAEDLASRVPAGLGVLREDLGRNFRAVLQSSLARLDLVTREEFDVQRAVLARLRLELTELERQIAELQSRG